MGIPEVGSLVELHFRHVKGGEMWIACEVFEVNNGALYCKPMVGKFPDFNKSSYMAVSISSYGGTWRYQ